MARTPPAPVAPALLTWARESIGLSLDEAARRQTVTPDRLTGWELGEDAPTVAQLRKAANVYRRPLAVFFLTEPPRDFQALKDFRRPRSAAEREWSTGLRLAVRRAHEQQEVVAELRELTGARTLRRPKVSIPPTEPRAFAEVARDLLGISLGTQYEWRDEYRALNSWIAGLETTGLFVLQASGIHPNEMQGFSITEGGAPIVVLNAADPVRRRIFTALHEFVHVLLNTAGVCDLHDRRRPRSEEERTELLCNEVAGAILMPADAMLGEPVVAAKDDGHFTNQEISLLAERYKVSREAAVRRLVSLGKTTWDFYWAKRAEYERGYKPRTLEEDRFGPTYTRRKVRDLGRGYVRMVLGSYHDGRITTLDAANYLEVNLKHLPEIEAEAHRAVATI
jgi:Zn-dependent peptidase ImmA (M78 family)